jgi:hypothetical protein
MGSLPIQSTSEFSIVVLRLPSKQGTSVRFRELAPETNDRVSDWLGSDLQHHLGVFEPRPCLNKFGPLSQMVEKRTHNTEVAGSLPARPTNKKNNWG